MPICSYGRCTMVNLCKGDHCVRAEMERQEDARLAANYEPDARAVVAPAEVVRDVRLPSKPLIRATCEGCRYANEIKTALVCYRNPPSVAVIEGVAQTMRVAINPGDFACGEYRAR
jgi:hypothetical protein